MTVPASRSRVYLNDFEVAVEFPPGCPLGASLSEPEMYSCPLAPEMFGSNKLYCPFELDVWQLGSSFVNFKVCKPTPKFVPLLITNFADYDCR